MKPTPPLIIPLVFLMVLIVVRPAGAASDTIPKDAADCYLPVDGGWQIRISGDPAASRLKPGSAIGVVVDDARAHRRPLYPPADRTLVWTKEELAQQQRVPFGTGGAQGTERRRIPFRPMILAANEPRFLVDLDSAGGLSGHLLLGLSLDQGPSKWLHQFSDLDVRYVNGQMEYALHDAAFPGVQVRLLILPLADSVGLVMKLHVEGVSRPGESFLTNPCAAQQLAQARSRSIAERVAVRTPDSYLNQAMPMMALATDGLWGDVAMVHGGWSWR